MKWGTAYDASYVNILYAMVKRHLTRPFRFICLTDEGDGIHPDIDVLPIPPVNVPAKNQCSPWRKVSLHASSLYDITGRTLFLDLDLIIVDNIDALFEVGDGFHIIENWTQMGSGVGNSSVFLHSIGDNPIIYDKFQEDPEAVVTQYPNSQTYVSRHIKDLHFWPADWIKSFKFHALPGGIKNWIIKPSLPEGCKILVFHGIPNPPEAAAGRMPGKPLKWIRAAPWVLDYWRE